ncbi:MAG: hypothetical protein DMG36_27165 [Acidobacteria bacterium]|nr:MAG: hypothetical protein DMG36_27165 [Acidobacteriota bacterium]
MIFMDCIGLIKIEVELLLVHLVKRKGRLKPATTAEFFPNRLAPCCINALNCVRLCGVEQSL